MKTLLTLVLALAGCYLKSYPVTPEVLDDSVYLAVAGMGTGTAWAVAPGFAVTAGHVCAGSPDRVYLKSAAGRYVPARPVIFEVSAGPEADACVLKAEGPLGRPLILADGMPAPGTPDFTVGYPLGIHAVSHGAYQGNGETSAPCDHGCSGGPVATARGVYQIVVQSRPDHPDDGSAGSSGTGVTELRALLDQVDAAYTLTPDPLPEDCMGNQIPTPDGQGCENPVE